jgi:diguanylate cyclase (GGDEF)-like protein
MQQACPFRRQERLSVQPFGHKRSGRVACWMLSAMMGLCSAGFSRAESPAVEVKALLAQAEAIQEQDPKRALVLSQRAYVSARASGDDLLLREAQKNLCLMTAQVDAPKAIPIADAGMTVSRKTGDLSSVASFLSCKGYALDLQGKPGESALIYESAVSTAEKAGDKEVLADALALRGENRHYYGRYDDAIKDLDRAYALNLELGLKSEQRYTLNAIANVYSDEHVGEFDKAIGYYRQLLKEDEASGLKSGVATARFNIASAMEMKGEYAAALAEYRRALQIDMGLGNPTAIAESELAIGALLVKLNNAAAALSWIERARMRFPAEDHESLARTGVVHAKALRALGRPREAIEDLLAAEQHFQNDNNPRYLAKVYEALSAARADVGEWRLAYEASLAYRETQFLLEKRARDEQSSRLRVQFDSAKKEQENRALLIENAHRGDELRNAERVRSLQRLTIVLGTALLALLTAMALQQVNKGQRLRALAMTDELTGLPNRRSILEFLDQELRAVPPGGLPLGLIAFDVDYFKRINDVYGHHGGDRVLREIGMIVGQQLPPEARAGRMGGEEFLAVVPGVESERLWQIADSLRRALSEAQFEGFREDERVTISLGVCDGGPADDVESLLRRADTALYRAKHEGRNRTVMD